MRLMKSWDLSKHLLIQFQLRFLKGFLCWVLLLGQLQLLIQFLLRKMRWMWLWNLRSVQRQEWLGKIVLSWGRRLSQILRQLVNPWVNLSHFQSQLVKATLCLNRYLWVNLMLSVFQRVRPLQKRQAIVSQKIILSTGLLQKRVRKKQWLRQLTRRSRWSVCRSWPWIYIPIGHRLWKSLGQNLLLKMEIWL